MSNDATNVQLVLDGKLFFLDDASPAPSGPDWTPGVNDVELGYYSEDGFVLTPVPGDETEFPAHNGDVVETDQLPGNWTVGFSGIETKKQLLEAYMDATVNPSDGSVTVTKASTEKRRRLVTVGISKDDLKVLTYYPIVKVSDREPITYNRTTLKAYGLTFRTFKHATYGHFKQWDDKIIDGLDPIAAQISTVLPSGRAATQIVQIAGIGFTGATDVKFGATSATAFQVINDGLIVATLPTGSAGSVNITVITPVGTSAAKAYTRA